MNSKIVSPQEWLEARVSLLAKEKQLTRLHDELAEQRMQLPWVRVDRPYEFEGPHGKVSLSELFGDKTQLAVWHFMLGPGWKEGCVGCSFEVDHIEGALVHLEHHDVTFVAVSRAPLYEIQTFKQYISMHSSFSESGLSVVGRMSTSPVHPTVKHVR